MNNTLTPLHTSRQTMDIVLEAIQDIIPYELAVILSLEDENLLKVRHAKGVLNNKSLMNHTLRLDRRPDLRAALEIGDVKVVEETHEPDHTDTYEGIVDLPMGHSCMLAPLQIEGKTYGLMTLDHSQCDLFTPQRVHIAKILSRIIAFALAETIAADDLRNENTMLRYERTAMISDIESVLQGMIGNAPKWKQVIEKVKLVAPTDSYVMILGETGTGKEQTAKAVHALSTRSSKPFIALNCSALNANLAESELFGHEKKSFTGAAGMRKGRFELADGGILFLDEVGDLPVEIQPKLLRAIQEGTFERIGGEKTIRADVRIISATNLNLEEKVKRGEFREDLYYRLNVFPITLPPLRERKEDIYPLSHYFLQRLSEKFGMRLSLSEEAVTLLTKNRWAGNVRELQNTLERAAILSRGGMIKPQHLLFEEMLQESEPTSSYPTIETVESYNNEMRNVILKALRKTGGKIYGDDGAAALLDMKPTTLQSKIKKLKIKVSRVIND